MAGSVKTHILEYKPREEAVKMGLWGLPEWPRKVPKACRAALWASLYRLLPLGLPGDWQGWAGGLPKAPPRGFLEAPDPEAWQKGT